VGALAALFAMPPLSAAEADATVYDQVSFSATAQAEVANDRLRAELYAQQEGDNASRLAAEVNRAIDWAVQEARRVDGVEVRTLDYRTHPLYRKQTLSGWRVRQAIELKSGDATVLSDLVGRLQQRLAVASVGYELSAAGRKAAESALIDEAVAAFRERAARVTRQFGRTDHRLVKVDIHGGGQSPRPMLRAAMSSAEASVAPPTLELGSQTVQITVSGTIELQVP